MAQTTLATIERSAAPAIGQTRLFINNAWVDPLDGTCFDTLNPATGEVIASVPQGGAGDIDRAVKAARRALESPPYSTMDAAELAMEAGFPPGILTIVNGVGEITGAALVVHPDVDKIAFTGHVELRVLADVSRIVAKRQFSFT